ncbi:hypothetical protein FACS18945_4050 [Bacteroidia bacterium]|nr:hypothetical protein FACS18945_4050 [Bacteroidia bacterium]
MFLLLSSSMWAKFNPEVFEVPYYELPKSQEYGNYKTYSLYAFYPQADGYSVDGYYQVFDEGTLKEDKSNGDFKIIVAINAITNPGISVKKDTALVTAQSVTGTLLVYDKTGNKVFNKKYTTNAPRAIILGDYSAITTEQKDALKSTLMQKLIGNLAKRFVQEDFSDTYLMKVAKTSVYKSPYIGNVLAFKTTPQEKELTEKVNELKNAGNPSNLLETAQSQIEYWTQLANLPNDKENSDYYNCGNFNLAFLYYLLDEQEKSNEYLLRFDGQKAWVKTITSFKENYSADKFKKPVLQGPFKHDEQLKSSVNTQELVDNYQYYVIQDATVTLKDGKTYTGVCKISYEDKNASQGNIASLDAADYDVVIDLGNAKAPTTLSKIVEIKAQGKTFALVKKSLYVAKVEGSKVSVFERVVPNDIVLHLYKKPDGDFEGLPIFGKGKWYKKYFADCPALLQKIDKDELENPVEIGEYYNTCK